MKVILETRHSSLNLISTFYYYHGVYATAGGLLVLEGSIRPVFSASALT